MSKYNREYYLKNADKIRARRRARYHANPEPDIQQALQWHKDNKDLVALRNKMYYWDDVEKFRARARESMRRFRARKKDAQRQAI